MQNVTLIGIVLGKHSFHIHCQDKSGIDLTNVQQINGDIINGASGQYYRAKSALDRAAEAKTSNNPTLLATELRTAEEEFARLKQGLDTFKVTAHANINNATVDEIYNSSYRLYSQAMVPMYEALKADSCGYLSTDFQWCLSRTAS